jgi:hypothetical protein
MSSRRVWCGSDGAGTVVAEQEGSYVKVRLLCNDEVVTYAPEEVSDTCPVCGGTADDPDQEPPGPGEVVADICTHWLHDDPEPSS